MTRDDDGWIEPDDPTKKDTDGTSALKNPSTDYIQVDPEDIMVTKRCHICLRMRLIRVDSKRCIDCKDKKMTDPEQLALDIKRIYKSQQTGM